MLYMHLNSTHFKLLSKPIKQITLKDFLSILFILKNMNVKHDNNNLLTMFFTQDMMLAYLKKANELNLVDCNMEKKLLQHYNLDQINITLEEALIKNDYALQLYNKFSF